MNNEIPKSDKPIYCPLCANTEMSFYFTSQYNRQGYKNYAYSLYKCDKCFLITIFPPPSNKIYPPSRDEENQYSAAHDFPWNKILLNTIKKYKTSGEFIDIGCNAGYLVQAAQTEGFSSMGVEIDEVAAKEALALKHNVLQGDFLSMNFSKKFDVIVMNHVLEHIPDFSKVPEKLHEMLADDGVIFIHVPHYYGLISTIMKNKWSTLAPFTHVWLFSATSMQKLFKNKFHRITIKTNTATEPHGYGIDLKTNIKTAIIQIANILSMGDEMRVILSKK
ncbi:MAG: hypothetical protein A2X86_13050 [Bdellovibrionales bacterium GWA2_49_15]|nr:MAG: hypothetical protein A2X86_13050 [Bdellovibrionales bacterium GWA2_49_15]HAZ13450.1 hypothetical protein [Bdellovibrionales bacterium]